ncbi:MAG: endoribonuclease YicC domain-containing protein, partial [Aquificaceae bacterium]
TYENEKWAVNVFVKSLNGKNLEVFIKSNYSLMAIEFSIRRIVREFLRRGTVSVQINIKRKDIIEPVNLEDLLTNIKFFKLIRDKLELNVSDDTVLQLATKFSEAPQEEIDPSLEEAISCALSDALKELLNRRFQEGEYIREDMESRIRRIESLLEEILKKREEVYEKAKRKILEKAQELGLVEDKALVINEISLVLSKMDIEEEITRFKSHLLKVKELMKSNEDVGRRLEFFFQEMHREITTLSNKLPDMASIGVEIKTEIDRLKQQVANVE